mmetsp:Transcript_486/g.1650  ORF Transcript_486/g.1650 Transcript_486/m.1650 type:complete len:226 (+) Transcript_486:1261-1938(+)
MLSRLEYDSKTVPASVRSKWDHSASPDANGSPILSGSVSKIWWKTTPPSRRPDSNTVSLRRWYDAAIATTEVFWWTRPRESPSLPESLPESKASGNATAVSPSCFKTRTPPCESPTAKYLGNSVAMSLRCGNTTRAVTRFPSSNRAAPVRRRWSVQSSNRRATAARSRDGTIGRYDVGVKCDDDVDESGDSDPRYRVGSTSRYCVESTSSLRKRSRYCAGSPSRE